MQRKRDDGVEDMHEDEGRLDEEEEHGQDTDYEVVLRVTGNY